MTLCHCFMGACMCVPANDVITIYIDGTLNKNVFIIFPNDVGAVYFSTKISGCLPMLIEIMITIDLMRIRSIIFMTCIVTVFIFKLTKQLKFIQNYSKKLFITSVAI